MAKSTFKLESKIELIPKVYFLVFSTNNNIDFEPGQFFSLEVAPKIYRSYSIVQIDSGPSEFFEETKKLKVLDEGHYVSFMINTKPGGPASITFENMQIGQEVTAVGPSGRFRLKSNSRPKVFIATGTGLGPFVPMINEVLEKDAQAKIDVLFGVYNISGSIIKHFFTKFPITKYPNLRIIVATDDPNDEDDSINLFHGQVTLATNKYIADFTNTDFYLCGNPFMVTAMETVLLEKGAKDNIFMEKFSTPK